GIAAAAGIILTMSLAIIYTPVGLLHRYWLNGRIQEEANKTPELDVNKWLLRNGIVPSPISIVTAFVAPLLSAILSMALNHMFK
ncbi:MAG TPA: hypothetical protein VFJ90_14465, partial [Candidatus Didemnitutus sp.]|nr:hypothetical protein [Candidatus Didemnitutus sp.]